MAIFEVLLKQFLRANSYMNFFIYFEGQVSASFSPLAFPTLVRNSLETILFETIFFALFSLIVL